MASISYILIIFISKDVHWVGVPQTNSGRKRLYLYYYDSNYKGICFLKIGFDKKSRIKIRHEMSALAKVRNTLNDAVSSLYVPSVLGFSSFKSCDVLVLEMIKSESNLHSEIEQARKDLILGFVGQGNIVSMDKVRGSSWFQYLDSERLYSADNFKHDFYNKFQSTIRLGSVHGDLTQANLVRSSKGVCVIDWEDYHDFAPTKVDCVNYDIQKYARMDCHKLVDNFTNENLNAVSDKEYFEILVALLFLAWSGREIASLIIDNWPEK